MRNIYIVANCAIHICIATGCFSVFIINMTGFSKKLCINSIVDKEKRKKKSASELLKGMCYSHFGNGSISITQKRFLNDNNKVNPLSEIFLNTIIRFAHASEHCKTYHISVSRNSPSSFEFCQITLLCGQQLKLDVLSQLVNTYIHYFKP